MTLYIKSATTEIATAISLKLRGYGVNPVPSECGLTLQHVMWMCEKIIENESSWPIDKLSRWLGYIQGILVMRNIYTLEEFRDSTQSVFHEAYSKDGVSIPDSIEPTTESK